MQRTVLIVAALSLLPWPATPCRANAGEGLAPRKRATFNYYEDARPSKSAKGADSETEKHGRTGDLKTATQQEYAEGRWRTVGTHFYRYYTDKSRQHRLKYVLEPDAYEGLKNDPEVSDPNTASEEKVAEYATKYVKYTETGEVVSEVSLQPAQPDSDGQPEMLPAEHQDSPQRPRPSDPTPGAFQLVPGRDYQRAEAYYDDSRRGIRFTRFDGATGALEHLFQKHPDGVKRVDSVTLYDTDQEGNRVPRRRAQYTYYGGVGGPNGANDTDSGTQKHGHLGDLQSVIQQEHVDGMWKAAGTTYYRYYTDAHRLHRMKYMLAPEDYERLSNDPQVSDPLTASDEKVAEYATRYFEYDDDGQAMANVSRQPAASENGDRLDVPVEEHENSSRLAAASNEERIERQGPAVPTQKTPSAAEALPDEQASSETADREQVDAGGNRTSRWWCAFAGAGAMVLILGVTFVFLLARAGSRQS